MARASRPRPAADARPRFSICIPTYNRADFLDDCLSRTLPDLAAQDRPWEVVISDNGSTDHTAEVVRKYAGRAPQVRALRQPANRGPWANQVNAYRNARGDVLAYLADDDSMLVEPFLAHVARMEAEPDLAVIFTDWIAWDDQQGRELHRYFSIKEPAVFAPGDPLGLFNFALSHGTSPEIGVFRRQAMCNARVPFARAMPFHPWMHALSREGRVRFDPLAFYREHRVPRAGLARTHWANMDMQLQLMGDEMRLSLETALLLALQDAGVSHLPPDQMEAARRMIDGFLHARTGLEIERACARGDFILAVELRRRQVLWNGPGSTDDIRRDVGRLVLPAAALSVALTYESLSDVGQLRLVGFASGFLRDFLARWRPAIPIAAPGASPNQADLVVLRDESTAAPAGAPGAQEPLVLEHLVRLYRVAREPVDLSRL